MMEKVILMGFNFILLPIRMLCINNPMLVVCIFFMFFTGCEVIIDKTWCKLHLSWLKHLESRLKVETVAR